jgi:hypothetical protein
MLSMLCCKRFKEDKKVGIMPAVQGPKIFLDLISLNNSSSFM